MIIQKDITFMKDMGDVCPAAAWEGERVLLSR
jgi:hypothetical protein